MQVKGKAAETAKEAKQKAQSTFDTIKVRCGRTDSGPT